MFTGRRFRSRANSRFPISLDIFQGHKEQHATCGQERQWKIHSEDPAPRICRLRREDAPNDRAYTVRESNNRTLSHPIRLEP